MRKKLTVVKMRRFTVQQRIWICIKYVELNRNAAAVRRQWIAIWSNIPPPRKGTISDIFKKFENEGTCHIKYCFELVPCFSSIFAIFLTMFFYKNAYISTNNE